MFGIAPEEAALMRLKHRYGWEPPLPHPPVDDSDYVDDPRWEEFVSRWERDDYPEIRETEGEGE